MRRKISLIFAGFFLLLFLGLAWLGCNSIIRRLDMMSMKSNSQAAEAALHSGNKKFAISAFRAAMVDYRQGLTRDVYYPVISSEYLTAGNACQQIRQPRMALQCYDQGLHYNPWSISLLTSLGGCAYRLGEYRIALAVLEKSQSIYPLKKKLQPVLQKLKVSMKDKIKSD